MGIIDRDQAEWLGSLEITKLCKYRSEDRLKFSPSLSGLHRVRFLFSSILKSVYMENCDKPRPAVVEQKQYGEVKCPNRPPGS